MNFAEDFPKAHATYLRGVADGHHFGMQVYSACAGTVVADEALGVSHLDGNPPDDPPSGRAARVDDLWLWLSACKPMGAIAVARLVEQGAIDIDAPVADVVPEFAERGKAPITLRHILTHTAGFPHVDLEEPGMTQAEALKRIVAAPVEPDWIIGETAGYHPRSSWYVLAEVVERIDGRSFAAYVREDIFEPLGMHRSWIGMPPAQYDQHREAIVPSYATDRGRCENLDLDSKTAVTAPLPGGNGRGPMRELGRFYEMLLNGGTLDGTRIVQADTVAEFTRAHRVGKMDTTFQHRMDWGLGFIIDSKQYGKQTVPYGYGDHASPSTYGHGGHMSATGFADPEKELVVAAAFNGLPGHPRHNKRIHDFCTAMYEDLGIAEA